MARAIRFASQFSIFTTFDHHYNQECSPIAEHGPKANSRSGDGKPGESPVLLGIQFVFDFYLGLAERD
jgi:hypothetical protein